MIGKVGYRRATSSSCADRCRCCHSGLRRFGLSRGRSSARAAHSRNREANSADPPTSSVTSWSSSSGSKTNSSAPGGSAVASGIRAMIPSSLATADPSTPSRSRIRAFTASAHGAWTGMPYGECRMSRQSPTSSRPRSTVRVRSVGSVPVASRCSARYARRLPRALASSPASRSRASAASGLAVDTSRAKAPSASPSSAGRPEAVAVPERHLARLPERGHHVDAVVRDVDDPPARRPEREDVVDARLVDHLLVELADAGVLRSRPRRTRRTGRDRESCRRS